MGGPDVAISMGELERGLPLSENQDQHQYATPDPPRSEYSNRKVTPKLDQRPWLGILHEFLGPNNINFAVPLEHRLSFFDIEVIHISTSGKVSSPIKCKNATDFQEAISSAEKERSGTLVIAEDLSGAMINTLGMQYDLEPEFFACHLLGTEEFRMGHWQSPTVRAPNVLPDYLRKAPYYTVEFRRPYHIPGGLKKIIELRSTRTSIPRGALIVKEDNPNVFVFETISVYKRKGSNFGMLYC
jgi:hypothetical protein